ncbi:hypothetical protein MKEN_00956800 [Mycena kentingensis (nom. inval.)]|nr:hypothetical protein MKEN_00956800 [Mycena kentingensis (nom. inval.)]
MFVDARYHVEMRMIVGLAVFTLFFSVLCVVGCISILRRTPTHDPDLPRYHYNGVPAAQPPSPCVRNYGTARASIAGHQEEVEYRQYLDPHQIFRGILEADSDDEEEGEHSDTRAKRGENGDQQPGSRPKSARERWFTL